MATPPTDLARCQAAIDLVEQRLREGCVPRGQGGGRSAVRAAGEDAMASGLARTESGFESLLRAAKCNHGLEPDWSAYRPARYQQPTPRAVVTIPSEPMRGLSEPQGRGERVLVIGDLHQDPRASHRLEALTWIGRHASEHRYDRIIQIGDWSTWDSVNTHDPNDTAAARLKPGIRDDMDNLKASHAAFRRGMAADYKPRLNVVLGNHENRLERFENLNPEAQDVFTLARDETFMQFGWRTRPYGEVFYVEGVGFTHHPVNGSGRAFGGKTGPQRAANESTISMVSGHTHRFQAHSAPKIGPMDSIMMVEVGCAMLWGEVEAYARHGMTGWAWGVCPMTVRDGQITDLSFVSMLTLRDRYSGAGGDICSGA